MTIPTINPQDYTASSYSGLPSWAQNILKGYMGKYGQRSWDAYSGAVGDINNGASKIDALRADQRQQFEGTKAPIMGALSGAISRAAGSGVSADTRAAWDARAAQEGLRASGNQDMAGRVWAANAKLANIGERLKANQNFTGMLGNYLGQARYSSSTDPTAWLTYLAMVDRNKD